MAWINSFNSDTSCRSCLNSVSVFTLDTDGVATSTILSASWASSSRLPLFGVEASAIRTFEGGRCRNNSCRKAPSVLLALSPRSCCMRRNSCDGVRSPNSSALNNCCNRHCSEAAVLLVSCSFNLSYGWSVGGLRIKSLTSVANSGASEATMWSNFVFCDVIPRVVNWALTCANQIWGSA